MSSVAPEIADRVGEIRDWEQVKLLTVRADRLKRWHRPGFIAIGDAAHAMSPIGGLGINVAIQDAVTAANCLWRPLSEGRIDAAELERVQGEREFPVRVLQAFQAFVQDRFLKPTLDQTRPPTIPLAAQVLARVPFLRDLPARLVGLGIRRPRVQSPHRVGRTSG